MSACVCIIEVVGAFLHMYTHPHIADTVHRLCIATSMSVDIFKLHLCAVLFF